MAYKSLITTITLTSCVLGQPITNYYCSTYQVDTLANEFTIQASNTQRVYTKGIPLSFTKTFGDKYDDNLSVSFYQENEEMYRYPVNDFVEIMNYPNHEFSDSYLTIKFSNCVPFQTFIEKIEKSIAKNVAKFPDVYASSYTTYTHIDENTYSRNAITCGTNIDCIRNFCANNYAPVMYNPVTQNCYYTDNLELGPSDTLNLYF